VLERATLESCTCESHPGELLLRELRFRRSRVLYNKVLADGNSEFVEALAIRRC